MECEIVARRWGNSIGFTLPKEVIEETHIKENQRIKILILNQNKILDKLFGRLKRDPKKSTQQIKDELRRELYND